MGTPLLELLNHRIPTGPYTGLTYIQRFHALHDPDGDCLHWRGRSFKNGYGRFLMRGRDYLAHRIAFVLSGGDLCEAPVICHRCDNRWCVNPKHLWLGTYRDNAQDMLQKGRGRPMRGELNWRCQFTEADVAYIRRARALGHNASELASVFGVSRVQIYRVATGSRR